jgi:hypothetical protein
MNVTRTSTMQGPTIKPPGLSNDFSEQETSMTASAMPPKFALTASAVTPPSDDANANGLTAQQQAKLEQMGLLPDEIVALGGDTARDILAASKRFAPQEWQQLWPVLKRLGLVGQMATILHEFYELGEWLTSPDAESLAVLEGFSYTNAEGKKMGGRLELAREGDRIGIRAIVPYDDFGNAVILNPRKTTTVLGRFVDSAKHPDGFKGAMNLPIGTNYFRFQEGFGVGENMGGGNVLDIAAWTWAKNNAWLQAAIDRGDIIRFVSDPTLKTSLFKKGNGIKDGLTVTGMELGVLLNRGFAPDPVSGLVKPCARIEPSEYAEDWELTMAEVADKGFLTDLDRDAYDRFLNQCIDPVQGPTEEKDKDRNVLSTQTNFFGGVAKTVQYD